ncbi:MAG: RDD family protein [bacterium]
MECPYCGFYHLAPQERCARCKKPLTSEENPENQSTGNSAPENEKALLSEEDGGEALESGADDAAEEEPSPREPETISPAESELAGVEHPSDAHESEEKADAELPPESSAPEEYEEEDSQEIEDYPEPASADYAYQEVSGENTSELVNQALQEIDLVSAKPANKPRNRDNEQDDSGPLSDEPVLAALLSDSDETEETGKDLEEDHDDSPPAAAAEVPETSGAPEEDPAPPSDAGHSRPSFEEPPVSESPREAKSRRQDKTPAPQKLFDHEEWDSPESFDPWDTEDNEDSRIEIKSNSALLSGSREGFDEFPDKEDRSGNKKNERPKSRPSSKANAAEESTSANGGFLLRRVLSGAIDLLIWLCFGGLLYAGARLIGGPPEASLQQWLVMVVFPLAVMSAILAMVYGGLFASMSGRTPGMMLCGSRMEDHEGKRPGLPRAFTRAGFYILCLAPFGLGLLTMLAGGPEGNLFDRITGTRVIKA